MSLRQFAVGFMVGGNKSQLEKYFPGHELSAAQDQVDQKLTEYRTSLSTVFNENEGLKKAFDDFYGLASDVAGHIAKDGSVGKDFMEKLRGQNDAGGAVEALVSEINQALNPDFDGEKDWARQRGEAFERGNSVVVSKACFPDRIRVAWRTEKDPDLLRYDIILGTTETEDLKEKNLFYCELKTADLEKTEYEITEAKVNDPMVNVRLQDQNFKPQGPFKFDAHTVYYVYVAMIYKNNPATGQPRSVLLNPIPVAGTITPLTGR